MIITRLFGGLGNQLFQYALGRRLAIEQKVSLKLDISWFETQTKRNYKLNYFFIDAQTATPQDIACVTKSNYKCIPSKFYLVAQWILPYYYRDVVYEKGLAFDSCILKARANAYMVGYWQSEKYFKSIGAILRNELTIKGPIDALNAEMFESINAHVDAVSVHVRRGDYVANPNLKALESLPVEYYQSAIQKMKGLLSDPFFFVFSDDIFWVKESIDFGKRVIYVEHNGNNQDYEDIRLMSACKHHIIANSSFSWWGAWLNPSQKKIVIAPKKWFKNPATVDKDVIPTNWIRL